MKSRNKFFRPSRHRVAGSVFGQVPIPARGSVRSLFPLIALVLFLVFALVLASACSRGGTQSSDGSGVEQGASGGEEKDAGRDGGGTGSLSTSYPLTITDDEGRQVTIPAEPKRVLSYAPSNTEILYALGQEDRIVGVDKFSDYPPRVKEKPSVGGLTDPNYEKIAELKPDLVLTITVGDQVRGELERLGLPVVVIQPRSLEETLKSIQLVGLVVNAQAEAGELVRTLRVRIEAVSNRVKDVPEESRPRVFYEVWNDPLMTAGPGSFIDDLIRVAGGRNVAHDADQAWPQFSLEMLVERDPQVILTTFQSTLADVAEGSRTGWADLEAVREGRVYLVDENLVSRPGPRIVDALEEFAELLHPNLFR